ncbi:hypothetical protein CRUP_005127 [Coryphaenoides rupestris]|nr:hypothetical protein CRUP_005127 [Coryphaenoides rupestris]
MAPVFTLTALINILILIIHSVDSTPLLPLAVEEYHFKTWMSQHNKDYGDLREYSNRLQIFTQNKRRIDLHNAGVHPFTNWRKMGNFVTPVKNQGHCGSCWTFSTTGCLESVTAIATGKLLLLSEQQLIDCAQAFNNKGCDGGLPSQAFEYIRYNRGIMSEDDYPYKGYDAPCQFTAGLEAALVRDVVNITAYDEKAMLDAVARFNPVNTVNHAVLAVGYGAQEDGGMPYWIVKNSWGLAWGMDGYFLIERGRNMCGLAACSSYPLV